MIVDSIYLQSPGTDWPFTIPAVQQIALHGLEFQSPVVFLVGENGSGKSTIVEAIADAFGLDPRGGHAGRRYATSQPKSALGRHLKIRVNAENARLKGRAGRGFFLRAETALGVFDFMSDYGVAGYGDKHLGTVSHGEGFLQVFQGRFRGPGLYLMDEPEAALSFTSCLALLDHLKVMVTNGAQVICATHSPLLASLPGAQILELTNRGIQSQSWEDLLLVAQWRSFLQNPETAVSQAP